MLPFILSNQQCFQFTVYSFQLFKSLHFVAIQRNKTLVEKTLTVINSGHSGTSRQVLISRTTKTQQNFENHATFTSIAISYSLLRKSNLIPDPDCSMYAICILGNGFCDFQISQNQWSC